jgi:hypothetical protein
LIPNYRAGSARIVLVDRVVAEAHRPGGTLAPGDVTR